MTIFSSVKEAIRAGYEILSIYPNNEGFLKARTKTTGGWAMALVRV